MTLSENKSGRIVRVLISLRMMLMTKVANVYCVYSVPDMYIVLFDSHGNPAR